MYGYIYKTTNKENGKIYIGQKKSNTFKKTYFGSGVLIKKAIEKYGKENFTVELIDFGFNADELDSLECYYIEQFKSKHTHGNYNIADGGFLPKYDINNQPKWRQDEIKEKMSKAIKQKILDGSFTVPSRKGVVLTNEHKEKLSIAHTGKKIPIEQREKMSNTHKKNAKGKEIELSSRFDGYRNNRKREIYVYVNGTLKEVFSSKKECEKQYSKLGLGKRPLSRNLLENIPICPEKRPVNMGINIWENRNKFKDYNFSYEEVIK